MIVGHLSLREHETLSKLLQKLLELWNLSSDAALVKAMNSWTAAFASNVERERNLRLGAFPLSRRASTFSGPLRSRRLARPNSYELAAPKCDCDHAPAVAYCRNQLSGV
jgi:hypothetical protein